MIAALAALGAFAMSVSAKDEIELRTVSLERGYVGGKVFAHAGGRSGAVSALQVKSFLNAEGDPVAVGSGGELVITRKADRRSVEQADDVLGKVKIPAGLERGILLLMSGGRHNAGKAVLIDDGKKAFPVGSFVVLNLTKGILRIDLEEKPHECKPGQATLIVDPPMRANSTSGMKAYRKQDDGWKMVSSTIWAHPGKRRVLQVVTEDERSGRIRLQGLRDVVE